MPDEISEAALIASAGMDPLEWLWTTNSFKRNLMHSIARRHREIEDIRDNNLAVRIVNGVIKGFGGK